MHLKVISSQQYKIDGTAGINVDSVIYKFSDLTKGLVVHLNITEELQERLCLKTRDIKIKTGGSVVYYIKVFDTSFFQGCTYQLN